MKILIISPSFPPQKCGIGDYTKILSRYLTNLGQEVEIITASSMKKLNKEYTQKPKINFAVDKWNWSALQTIKRLIQTSKADWVVIEYSIAGYSDYHPMISFLPMFIKFWRLNCKTLVTIHEITPPRLFGNGQGCINRLFGLFCTAMLLSFANKIIVCSNWVFGEIKKKTAIFSRFLKSRIYFVPIGSNIAVETVDKLAQRNLLGKYNLEEKDFIVCFFGFIRQGRDLETLIKAYKLLLEDGCDMKLLMLGGVLDEQCVGRLRTLSKTLEISDKIIWTGMLASKDVSMLLGSVDICVSVNCPRGISLSSGSFQAAAIHGLPIITNYSKYQPQELIDKENIVFINPGNEEELTKAILKLYNSDELREKISKNIKEYSKDFTWEKIAEKINSILKLSCD